MMVLEFADLLFGRKTYNYFRKHSLPEAKQKRKWHI